MLPIRLLTAYIMVAGVAGAAGNPADSLPTNVATSSPPVLREREASETGVFKLPGAPETVETALARELPTVQAPAAPKPHAPQPAELLRESSTFCQKQIGHWTESDASASLGVPVRRRAAIDDDTPGDGHILAYRDPGRQYRELELDFDPKTGLLRAVFAYPQDLSWQQCRRIWGSKVNPVHAGNGRTFYSYTDRSLDVLVDASGKVISLGLY